MYLEELLNKVQLENDRVECKSRLNRADFTGVKKSAKHMAFPISFPRGEMS